MKCCVIKISVEVFFNSFTLSTVSPPLTNVLFLFLRPRLGAVVYIYVGVLDHTTKEERGEIQVEQGSRKPECQYLFSRLITA